MIYVATAHFPGAHPPVRTQAASSKASIGRACARLAEMPGARHILVAAYTPLPRKLPFGVSHTEEDPQYLGGGANGICQILNGQWYSSAVTLIEFISLGFPLGLQGFPKDIYSQVLAAKVPS